MRRHDVQDLSMLEVSTRDLARMAASMADQLNQAGVPMNVENALGMLAAGYLAVRELGVPPKNADDLLVLIKDAVNSFGPVVKKDAEMAEKMRRAIQ
jgi:hypothetical protein